MFPPGKALCRDPSRAGERTPRCCHASACAQPAPVGRDPKDRPVRPGPRTRAGLSNDEAFNDEVSDTSVEDPNYEVSDTSVETPA